MKNLKLRLKILFQAMYVAWVTEPILREKGRSIYSRKDKIASYNASVDRLNELKLLLK